MELTETIFQQEIANHPNKSHFTFSHDQTKFEATEIALKSRLWLGIHFRAIQSLENPFFRTPSLFTFYNSSVFVATEIPTGVVLQSCIPSTYHEARELLLPLGHQLVSLHQQGFIHAAIFEDRCYFSPENQSLTTTNVATWLLNPLSRDFPHFPPPELLHNDVTPATDVYLFARLLLILSGVAREKLATPDDWDQIPDYARNLLASALAKDPTQRPQSLASLIHAISPECGADIPPHFLLSTEGENISLLNAIVSHIETFENPNFGSGVRFHATVKDSKHQEKEWKGFLYRSQIPDVFHILTSSPDYSRANLLNWRIVSNNRGESILSPSPDTLFILEPNWPVSVTDTVTAIGCVRRPYVDLLDSGKPNLYLVKGILIHNLLNELAKSLDASFDEAWDTFWPELRIQAIAANLTDRNIEALKNETREHFETIARILKATHKANTDFIPFEVEVNRHSPLIGIEGRIDAIRHFKDYAADTHQIEILELKSGKMHSEHFDQVQCYQLLWDAYCQSHQIPLNAFLLYSRNGIAKEVQLNRARIRRILHSRNQIVLSHNAFVTDQPSLLPSFMEQPPLCQACGFRQQRCKEQSGMCDVATTKKSIYFNHLRRLVEIENWQETLELGEIFSSAKLEYRIAEREAIDHQYLDSVVGDVANFRGTNDRVFAIGDIVVAHQLDAEGNDILRGQVCEINDNTLSITLNAHLDTSNLADDNWIIEKLPARIGYRANLRSLYRFFREADQTKWDAILTPTLSSDSPNDFPTPDSHTFEGLNPRQRTAAAAILSNEPVTLVQGPPGTGKSTLITEVVKELLRRGARILVSTHTNTAIDTLLEKFVDAGIYDFLRIGSKDRSPSVAKRLEHAGVNACAHFTEDIERLTDDLKSLKDQLVTPSIIAATTFRCNSHPLFDILETTFGTEPFDLAIIDEATQIPEPMTLAPYSRARKLVLVGDHQQLPPIVRSERAHSIFFEPPRQLHPDNEINPPLPVDNCAQTSLFALFQKSNNISELKDSSSPDGMGDPLMEMRLAGLDRSMFERLVLIGHKPILLNTQYRMHQNIMAFSNRTLYNEEIIGHSSTARNQLKALAAGSIHTTSLLSDAVLSPENVIFLNVDGEEQGTFNQVEAETAAKIVRLLTANHAGESIGVISPYRAQIRTIRALLSDIIDDDLISADTVERFQGAERDIIVLSFVRTSRPTDFLCDIRRLNVSLTRARKKLILIGKRECLIQSSILANLINQPETSSFDLSTTALLRTEASLETNIHYA